MSLMMAKCWTLFQEIWLWIVSDMGIPFTTEKIRTSIWHWAQKWNHLEDITGEDPEESKVCLIATYLAYCFAGIWNYEWLGLLFEDLFWHNEFGKGGQEQPTLVFMYKRHNNIRTNVGVVIRNGTKLLVVISMALLRYITVVLKKSEHQFWYILSDFSKKSKKQFWYKFGVLKKSKNQSNNLLQTCQLFHENLKFLEKPELEVFWVFDFQKKQVIWFWIFKRGPKPGCDALLCLTSCSCVLSNSLCCLSL